MIRRPDAMTAHGDSSPGSNAREVDEVGEACVLASRAGARNARYGVNLVNFRARTGEVQFAVATGRSSKGRLPRPAGAV